MKVIDVYQQYFQADCVYNNQPRKGASVCLTYTYEEGIATYKVGITFFPYRDPEDMVISYDAFSSKVVYQAPGRRSKKREAQLLADFSCYADKLAERMGGKIFWDKPITDARYG